MASCAARRELYICFEPLVRFNALAVDVGESTRGPTDHSRETAQASPNWYRIRHGTSGCPNGPLRNIPSSPRGSVCQRPEVGGETRFSNLVTHRLPEACALWARRSSVVPFSVDTPQIVISSRGSTRPPARATATNQQHRQLKGEATKCLK
jgi:hypothetical protein